MTYNIHSKHPPTPGLGASDMTNYMHNDPSYDLANAVSMNMNRASIMAGMNAVRDVTIALSKGISWATKLTAAIKKYVGTNRARDVSVDEAYILACSIRNTMLTYSRGMLDIHVFIIQLPNQVEYFKNMMASHMSHNPRSVMVIVSNRMIDSTKPIIAAITKIVDAEAYEL